MNAIILGSTVETLVERVKGKHYCPMGAIGHVIRINQDGTHDVSFGTRDWPYVFRINCESDSLKLVE